MFETENFNLQVATEIDESNQSDDLFTTEARGRIREEILEGGHLECDELEIFISKILRTHKATEVVASLLEANDYFLSLYEDK